MTDPLGNVTGGNSTANTTVYTYNAWDELTSESQPWPESGTGPYIRPTTSYTYDLSGNQTSVTDPDGNVTSSVFDQRNQVTSMTGPAVAGAGTATTGYHYDADGNLTETDTPDGNKIIDTYDDDDRLTGQLYNNSGGSTVQAIGYTPDADGRITGAFSNVSSASNQSSTLSYGYDDDGRLTGETTTYTGYGVVVGKRKGGKGDTHL